MSPKQLLAYFDRIAEAPGAVPRLRRFILDLAVRGKLVEQDPADEPATETLELIRARQRSAVPSRKGLHLKASPSIDSQAGLFELPLHWTWARLGQIVDKIHYGYTTSADWGAEGARLVRITDIQDNSVKWAALPGCVIMAPEVEQYRLAPGDILVARTGGTVGKTFLVSDVPVEAVFASYLIRVRPSPSISARFLKAFLESPVYWRQLVEGTRGGAQPNVNGRALSSLLLPIPPVAEQHRIVAKVDELMALCDRLEAAQAEREQRRDQVIARSYQPVRRSGNGCSTEKTNPFSIGRTISEILRRRQLPWLRQRIAQIAFDGGFSPTAHWPTPRALSELVALQNGYAFKSEWFVKTGTRLLRNVNVGHGSVRWDQTVCLSNQQAAQFERFALDLGDIVFSLDRPFISTGVKVARIAPADLPALLLQRVGRIQFKSAELTPEYLFLWMQSAAFVNQIDPGRSNGVPHVSSKQVEAVQIVVPDPVEQSRIVTIIQRLLHLCDRLEESLALQDSRRYQLLESVLRSTLVDRFQRMTRDNLARQI
jgi:type I restriction enzyme, S subunit